MQKITSRIRYVALSAFAVLVPLAAGAATFSEADFEMCNRAAMAAAGITDRSPSASGSGVTGEKKTAPAASPSTTPPGQTSPSAPAASPSTAPGTLAEGAGTGGKAADAQLEAIVQAYRECLKAKM
jgi:hypothetical protein